MPEMTTDDIIDHGLEGAKLALEYIMTIVSNPAEATEDEGRAVIVAICACIAALNVKLLKGCNAQSYRESQDLIIKLMEGFKGTNTAQKGKE